VRYFEGAATSAPPILGFAAIGEVDRSGLVGNVFRGKLSDPTIAELAAKYEHGYKRPRRDQTSTE